MNLDLTPESSSFRRVELIDRDANPFIRGLCKVMSQRFCDQALKEFGFVNREQEVGEPGPRMAKEGYHPRLFVEKHIAMFL